MKNISLLFNTYCTTVPSTIGYQSEIKHIALECLCAFLKIYWYLQMYQFCIASNMVRAEDSY